MHAARATPDSARCERVGRRARARRWRSPCRAAADRAAEQRQGTPTAPVVWAAASTRRRSVHLERPVGVSRAVEARPRPPPLSRAALIAPNKRYVRGTSQRAVMVETIRSQRTGIKENAFHLYGESHENSHLHPRVVRWHRRRVRSSYASVARDQAGPPEHFGGRTRGRRMVCAGSPPGANQLGLERSWGRAVSGWIEPLSRLEQTWWER